MTTPNPNEQTDFETSDGDPTASEDLGRYSARAMVATYVQMTNYAALAQSLQRARIQSLQSRIERATDVGEATRLKRRIDAQTYQAQGIEGAVSRFKRRVQELKKFSVVGLTQEDLAALGVDALLRQEEGDSAEQPPREQTTRSASEDSD